MLKHADQPVYGAEAAAELRGHKDGASISPWSCKRRDLQIQRRRGAAIPSDDAAVASVAARPGRRRCGEALIALRWHFGIAPVKLLALQTPDTTRRGEAATATAL
jgi:hypothetical protein